MGKLLTRSKYDTQLTCQRELQVKIFILKIIGSYCGIELYKKPGSLSSRAVLF